MRDLFETEFKYVSGAGSSPSAPSGCGCSPCPPSKNNNGYGNGSEYGTPPGQSGDHNPQLMYAAGTGGKNAGPAGGGKYYR